MSGLLAPGWRRCHCIEQNQFACPRCAIGSADAQVIAWCGGVIGCAARCEIRRDRLGIVRRAVDEPQRHTEMGRVGFPIAAHAHVSTIGKAAIGKDILFRYVQLGGTFVHDRQ